jgi:hypothetical protein
MGFARVGLTAKAALVPFALVPPGQRATAVLAAHSSVIREMKLMVKFDPVDRLFRYVPKKHLDSFLDGQVLFRTLSYYRDYELDSFRGDILEGNRAWRPQEGLQMNFVETGSNGHFQESTFIQCQKQMIYLCLA